MLEGSNILWRRLWSMVALRDDQRFSIHLYQQLLTSPLIHTRPSKRGTPMPPSLPNSGSWIEGWMDRALILPLSGYPTALLSMMALTCSSLPIYLSRCPPRRITLLSPILSRLWVRQIGGWLIAGMLVGCFVGSFNDRTPPSHDTYTSHDHPSPLLYAHGRYEGY